MSSTPLPRSLSVLLLVGLGVLLGQALPHALAQDPPASEEEETPRTPPATTPTPAPAPQAPPPAGQPVPQPPPQGAYPYYSYPYPAPPPAQGATPAAPASAKAPVPPECVPLRFATAKEITKKMQEFYEAGADRFLAVDNGVLCAWH